MVDDEQRLPHHKRGDRPERHVSEPPRKVADPSFSRIVSETRRRVIFAARPSAGWRYEEGGLTTFFSPMNHHGTLGVPDAPLFLFAAVRRCTFHCRQRPAWFERCRWFAGLRRAGTAGAGKGGFEPRVEGWFVVLPLREWRLRWFHFHPPLLLHRAAPRRPAGFPALAAPCQLDSVVAVAGFGEKPFAVQQRLLGLALLAPPHPRTPVLIVMVMN